MIQDYLEELLGDVAADTSGALANYIPELAAADPERLGTAFGTVDGVVYGAGDVDSDFTIQSISKPFAYALALADRGFDAVRWPRSVSSRRGEAFNQISLERDTGRPLNPMINAGAIVTHSLAGPGTLGPGERTERVVEGLSAFAGRRLQVDEAVCTSELGHAHRNLAIAHMLRSHDVLTEDPAVVVDGLHPAVLRARHDAGPGHDGGDVGQPRCQTPLGGAGGAGTGGAPAAQRHVHLRHVRRGR